MWTIFEEKKVNEENVSYTAYGVRKMNFCIGDFSSDRAEAERFADLLNKHGVSEEHAADVAEDYFGSF